MHIIAGKPFFSDFFPNIQRPQGTSAYNNGVNQLSQYSSCTADNKIIDGEEGDHE